MKLNLHANGIHRHDFLVLHITEIVFVISMQFKYSTLIMRKYCTMSDEEKNAEILTKYVFLINRNFIFNFVFYNSIHYIELKIIRDTALGLYWYFYFV